MIVLDHQLLPPELWLEIFYWATIPPNGYDPTATYTPFSPNLGGKRDGSLWVKACLTHVCRQWRRLTLGLLYVNLTVHRGVPALRQALEKGAAGSADGFGHWVRCIVLPYSSTATTEPCHKETNVTKILQLCTGLTTLIRPRTALDGGLRFEYDAQSVLLPSLERLEWWHFSEAERSGGINSLGFVLQNAPNLRYIFVGGSVGPAARICVESTIPLPHLHTLRLHIVNGILVRQIVTQWQMHNLRRLVMDSPLVDHSLHLILQTFGAKLSSLEFGKHLRFMLQDYLLICLENCPNLEEIHYYLFFTSALHTDRTFPSITTIGLHAAVNSSLYDVRAVWDLIEQHFTSFGGTMYPNLKRLKLYGQWRGILDHPHFPPFRERVDGRGCVFEIMNPS